MSQIETTSPKPFCFVLMPLPKEFDDVYQIGIKEACGKAGAYCERVDEQIFRESILDRIYNQIAKADFIVADMTGKNPNVFYEVGYAHALGKVTLLLTRNADDIPFDLKHFPHIVYGESLVSLREELTKRVKWYVTHPPENQADTKIEIELFLGDTSLASGDAVYLYKVGTSARPHITVYNGSSQTFEPGKFQVGVVSDRFTDCLADSHEHGDVYSTKLPKGGHLHILPDFPTLFPQAYASKGLVLIPGSEEEGEIGREDTVIFRVFCPTGTRDFPLTVRRVEQTEDD